jgi:hypothetical protein
MIFEHLLQTWNFSGNVRVNICENAEKINEKFLPFGKKRLWYECWKIRKVFLIEINIFKV